MTLKATEAIHEIEVRAMWMVAGPVPFSNGPRGGACGACLTDKTPPPSLGWRYTDIIVFIH